MLECRSKLPAPRRNHVVIDYDLAVIERCAPDDALDLELEDGSETLGIGERAYRPRRRIARAEEIRRRVGADFRLDRAIAARRSFVIIACRAGDVDDERLTGIITDVQSNARTAIAKVTIFRVEVDDAKNLEIRIRLAKGLRQWCCNQCVELLTRLDVKAQSATGTAVVV
jgi:hypothetical protein